MADAKLILKPPHMQVRMKPGFAADVPKMLDTIRRAGYQPIEEEVELMVSGKVVRQGEGLALELDRVKQPVTLAIVPAKQDTDTAAHLERHVDQVVELVGRWQAPQKGAAGPGSLAVTAIPKAKEGGGSPREP